VATREQPLLRACRLSAAPVAGVLELIAEERQDWKQRLSWDPSDLGEALELAASARMLVGAAVLRGRRPVAYLSAHVSKDTLRPCSLRIRPDAPPETARVLVDAALGLSEAAGRQVEAQLTAFEHQEALDAAFAARGAGVVAREWLSAALVGELPEGPARSVRPWSSDHLEACAEALSEAHEGGVEALINSAFRSPEAATTYLKDVVRGPGCGYFQPWASSLVVENGRVLGFCLVTTVAPGVAHLPQVAVRPEAQGRGLGAALLDRAWRAARAEGCRRMTLSVSLENQRARSWYVRRGFSRLAALSAYHRAP
jgi:ribosomal protein S18 acetylase RimI-like enzyme